MGYFAYGVNVCKGQPGKVLNSSGIPKFNSQMPVNAINALPRAMEQLLHPGRSKTSEAANKDILWGRLFSILSALLLGVYVFIWAKQLYGYAAGLLSLLLYVCSPDIAAHSQLVGTDVYSFLACTATCCHTWRYAKTGNYRQLLLLALWLGIGQLTKPSLLLLYPVTGVLLGIRLYNLKETGKGKKIVYWLREQLLIGAISLVLINIGFLFSQSGQPLGQYKFASERFQQLQTQLSFIRNMPLPLPAPYIQGFDYIQFNTETGPGKDGVSAYGHSWFLGEKMGTHRVWYYYIVCCLYKLPLGFWLLLMMAIGFCMARRQLFSFGRNGVFLWLPVLFIFGMFSLFNTMYHGIRNIAMILPLLFVFCGSLTVAISGYRRLYSMVILLLVWQVLSVASYFPHLLPYTNELIWHKKDAHHIFTDSNIYFQEGLQLVKAYLAKHPEVQYEPETPVKGRVMVSLDTYYDFWETGRLEWLRALQLEPVDHFDSGYLIFNIGD